MRFTKNEHLSKALANEQLASTLPLSESAVEWAITLLFYAAVHYVQAYFALDGRSYTSHPSRNKAIARDPVISVVSDAYESLYNLSRDARYEVMHLQPGHLTYAQSLLEEITTVIKPLL